MYMQIVTQGMFPLSDIIIRRKNMPRDFFLDVSICVSVCPHACVLSLISHNESFRKYCTATNSQTCNEAIINEKMPLTSDAGLLRLITWEKGGGATGWLTDKRTDGQRQWHRDTSEVWGKERQRQSEREEREMGEGVRRDNELKIY